MAKNWAVYFGRTGAEHQANLDELKAEGFRMTALSAYGNSDEPMYAAVWAKVGGTPWVHCYGLQLQELKEFLETWTAQGFRPKMVTSVTQPETRLAAVLEKGPEGPIAAFDLRRQDFDARDRAARADGLLLSWISTTANENERISAVWKENTDNVDYYRSGPHTALEFQKVYEELTARSDGLAFVTVTADNGYDSIWYRDAPELNRSYMAQYNLSSSGFEGKFDELKSRGWRPALIQVGGDADNPRFAAMFRQKGE